MKTVDVRVKDLPEKAQVYMKGYLTWTRLSDGEPIVYMDAHPNNGGHFIFGKDDLPAIAMLDNGRRAYLLDDVLKRNAQDGSDLPLYEEIFDLAHLKKEKDDETCTVIRGIDFLLIAPLLENILNNQENETLVRELRGRILRTKFNAVTIWREGQPKKAGKDAR